MTNSGYFLFTKTMSGVLRCLRGGYYMREEVRERILLLAVHDRDAMGYAMGL